MEMRLIARASALLSVVMVAGCTARQPGPAAQSLDRAAITAQMLPMLQQKQFVDYIGDQGRCAAYFDLISVAVTDEMLDGRTGRVEAQVMIQARRATRADVSASMGCYGAPPGGWAAGQTARAIVVADVEQWNGQWRLISMPVVRPVQ